MYKYLKYILFCILIFLISVYIGKVTSKNFDIIFKDDKLKYNIILKGAKNSRDITADDKGNLYIAYKSRIQFTNKNGKSYDVIKNKCYDINSIEYLKNKLYFSSKDKIYCLDIKDKVVRVIVKDLPNLGDYKESKLLIKGEKLYISIGTATNSGIVGYDNTWVKQQPYFCDCTPFDLVLKGKNYEEGKTGAFVPFATQNRKSQIISGHTPGNGSLIVYNLDNGKMETFAWGIRNIKGMDYTSKGKIIASVGGIENRGLRPVNGDVDYIYDIRKGVWYGWPDFSGGDPLTSPRFRRDKAYTETILESPPNLNPPAPIYQHKNIKAITAVAVDKNAVIGEKDSIYFYDDRDNIIYRLSNSGQQTSYIILDRKSKICQMKFINNKLLILDVGIGYIYEIS